MLERTVRTDRTSEWLIGMEVVQGLWEDGIGELERETMVGFERKEEETGEVTGKWCEEERIERLLDWERGRWNYERGLALDDKGRRWPRGWVYCNHCCSTGFSSEKKKKIHCCDCRISYSPL